ncbi:hypothetical protein THMIRHAM_18450 [Thiomicrorhabdus immobilis]|uniref:DUF3379 domain-containing protein n=1 Tax=Thiomicrorhabdus immobilis TaxID=2791037 RepID=A0ABN6CY44_9GAMM|nr:DUF3379 family protein [Thiomicrorhabdus immobilis]BCN94060.1 hypothetical protein THMIRHAM_18450 [Thiomicrorhabdus immobilis]
MNEMTFHGKLLTQPENLDDEILAYIEKNPDKKQLLEKAREFEQQIAGVLEVDVPEGLHARLLLNQSNQQNNESQESHQAEENAEKKAIADGIGGGEASDLMAETNGAERGWFSAQALGSWQWGLAASVLGFAIVLGLWQTPQSLKAFSGEATIDHILAHIQEDPTLMTAVKLPNSNQELQQLFANVGAQLAKPVEGMSYAGMCDVEGQQGLHIVMQEQGQPITIIVIPGQQVSAIEAFHKSGYQGELIPVKGGVVAIVANSMEQLALAQIRFFKAVRFV